MLSILVGAAELYDEEKQEFVVDGGFWLELEHSLLSMSKWESKWEVPFLSTKDKTPEQTLSYIEMMVVSPNPPAGVLQQLDQTNLDDIGAYIERKMTATWFSDDGKKGSRSSEVITSELVYYWMSSFNIPFECEHWNLNRLFTLLRIHQAKSQTQKKKSRAEIMRENRELNERRKRELQTKG